MTSNCTRSYHFFTKYSRLCKLFTDLRFLSIDFLNTFLLTYRVFTDGETVLNALKKVFYDAQPNGNATHEQTNERLNLPKGKGEESLHRRTSGASSVSGMIHTE